MEYPRISIVVATLNSQETLLETLESIKKQNYPQEKIEILIIDGGSKDNTLDIANNFKCQIINNPKVDQVYAKYLGWLNSKGKYLLFLDSDEALESVNSLRNKIIVMLRNPKVKVVISSGYKNFDTGFQLNNYVNEFGDPFSFFMYRISKGEKYFLEELERKNCVIRKDNKAVVFNFTTEDNPPFIELTSMGVQIDREYVKSDISEVFKNVSMHTHLFYLLNLKKCLFAVMKHDSIRHRSVYSALSYFKKINSRIKNNLYQTNMGKAGFVGREIYQPFWYRVKKLLFIPYTILVLPVFVDGIFLALKKRKSVYLMHIVLSYYTLILIVYYLFLKILGIKVKLVGYGT